MTRARRLWARDKIEDTLITFPRGNAVRWQFRRGRELAPSDAGLATSYRLRGADWRAVRTADYRNLSQASCLLTHSIGPD